MSNQNLEMKMNRVRELLETGKAKGSLTYKEIMDQLVEVELEPEQFETPPPGRRSIPGSLVWVPATAGLLLCQHVVTELIK